MQLKLCFKTLLLCFQNALKNLCNNYLLKFKIYKIELKNFLHLIEVVLFNKYY